jgi:hypothetical protein
MIMRTERRLPLTQITAGVLSALLAASNIPLSAQGSNEAREATPVSEAQPLAVADAFSRALAAGDTGTVRALLLPDVLIYESGGAETSAAEYASHHMPGDMAFLSELRREQLSQLSGGDASTAWVATRTRLTGRYKGKDVDLNNTETLVMTRTNTGWRIAHIHWSSKLRSGSGS